MTILVGIISFIIGGVIGAGIMTLVIAAGDENNARRIDNHGICNSRVNVNIFLYFHKLLDYKL